MSLVAVAPQRSRQLDLEPVTELHQQLFAVAQVEGMAEFVTESERIARPSWSPSRRQILPLQAT